MEFLSEKPAHTWIPSPWSRTTMSMNQERVRKLVRPLCLQPALLSIRSPGNGQSLRIFQCNKNIGPTVTCCPPGCYHPETNVSLRPYPWRQHVTNEQERKDKNDWWIQRLEWPCSACLTSARWKWSQHLRPSKPSIAVFCTCLSSWLLLFLSKAFCEKDSVCVRNKESGFCLHWRKGRKDEASPCSFILLSFLPMREPVRTRAEMKLQVWETKVERGI